MNEQQRAMFDTWTPVQQQQYRQQWMAQANLQQQQQQVASAVQMEVDDQPTVKDAEAFAAKHMPDLGQEVEDFQIQSWTIKNWSTQPKRLQGPTFTCGGHQWRILLFPQGNANGTPNDMVSIYLDYANPKGVADGWHACAQFALAISNPQDPSIYTVSHAHHRFVAEECDWGFTRFADLRKLHSAHERGRPTIENDEVEVTAFVRVLKDPTGVLWHSFLNYSSRETTGFVGLKNQGATCYMNSFLQHCFVTTALKQAVFQIPTDDDVPTESLALALQRLFYGLETNENAVSTLELTRSFGWSSADAFTQHDCQEFARILEDKLEERMKGTAAEGTIPKLLKGSMKSFIRCLDIPYESSREEEFYDLQLSVKGLPDLEASFKDYISVETLDGDNKYSVDGKGLQRANKGVSFSKLPPLLHLHLRRFAYDFETDAMAKINDRFEFPFSIDLAPYLDDDSPEKGSSQIYHCHGVMIHSGDVASGHYWSLLRPTKEDKWFKYDDDRVIPILPKDVIEESFGGDAGVMGRQQRRTARSFTSAYFLIYIKETAVEEILRPFDLDEIPKHIKNKLQAEKEAAEAKRREREEQHLFLTVKVITDETFSKHSGFDMAVFEDKNFPASDLPSFKLLKTETLATFKERLAKYLGFPTNETSIWSCVGRQNRTFRVDAPLGEDQLNETMETIRTSMSARSHDLRLYACRMPEGRKPGAQDILLFTKFFDVEKQQIRGASHVLMDKSAKVGDIQAHICEKMNWAPSTAIRLTEEIKIGMIEALQPRQTLTAAELQSGDIICFTVALSEKEQQDYETRGMIASIPAMYDYLSNAVRIQFSPRYGEPSDENPTFTLTLSRKQTYDTVAAKVGEHLGFDPARLRFTTSSNGQPKSVVRRSLNPAVSELLQTGYYNNSGGQSLLFYEKLQTTLADIETKKSLVVHYVNAQNRESGQPIELLLPKTMTYAELSDNIAKAAPLSKDGSGKLKIFDISTDGRHQVVKNASEMIGGGPGELWAEEVPMEEIQVPEHAVVVDVFHYYRQPAQWHGVPLRFQLKEGETVADMKLRLRERMGFSEKDFAKIKLSLIQQQVFKQPSPLADGESPHLSIIECQSLIIGP